MHITTVPMSLAFLRGQAGYMKARGFGIRAVSSPGEELDAFSINEGVPTTAIHMPRRITPHRDLVAVWRLTREIRRRRPDIVHAHTPKGGLLGMIAAVLARTPVRVYHIHGFPYSTASGRKRVLLKTTERISCRIAHRVLCVSHSLRDVAIEDGIVGAEKIRVLAGGSINGVDAAGRYDPDRFGHDHRARICRELGIPDDARVIGFVGRIVRDKGIHELAEAWTVVRSRFPNAHLVLAGPLEPQDAISSDVLRLLRGDRQVHFTGWVEDTSALYPVFDIVTLPSYREGFGLVAIEAAAMRLPVVATSIPGCVDAVRDGVTGTLVPPRDAGALADALETYLEDADLRRRHGEAGRARVLREFRQEVIWEALHHEYDRLLRERDTEPRDARRGRIED